MVKTSQGSSLVALAAALTEGHSNEVSTCVLYELAKLSKAPAGLTPSFSQWEAVVKVSSSVFNESILGPRINQLSRIAGLSDNGTIVPSHPSDLAQVIMALGAVAEGRVETIDIEGGPACSWVFVWTDFVLGLRVEARSAGDITIAANYDTTLQQPQVRIRFSELEDHQRSVSHVGRTFVLRSGSTFVKSHFGSDSQPTPIDFYLQPFSGGRIKWENILETCFGKELMSSLLREKTTKRNPQTSKTLRNYKFSSLLVWRSLVLFYQGDMSCQFPDITSFWRWSPVRLPELRSIQGALLQAAQAYQPCLENDAKENYRLTKKLLRSTCRCLYCNRGSNSPGHERSSKQCLIGICEFILGLLTILSDITLHAPLTPSYSGVMRLYLDMMATSRDDGLFWDNSNDCLENPYMVSRDEYKLRTMLRASHSSPKLEACLQLFSHDPFKFKDSRPGCCAKSTGKLYAYLETMADLTHDATQAARIHVGSGSIEFNSRLYDAVNDAEGSGSYTIEELVQYSGEATLPKLMTKAMAEETAGCLSFWYQINCHLAVFRVPAAELTAKLASTLQGHRLASSMKAFDHEGTSSENRTSFRAAPDGPFSRCISFIRSECGVINVGEEPRLSALTRTVSGCCLVVSSAACDVYIAQDEAEIDRLVQWLKSRDGS